MKNWNLQCVSAKGWGLEGTQLNSQITSELETALSAEQGNGLQGILSYISFLSFS